MRRFMIPTRDKVLVERAEVEGYRMGGMMVPDTVRDKIVPCQGRVVRVGKEVRGVREGDKVVFGLGVGIEVGGGLLVLPARQVVCKVEEEGEAN